MIIGALLTVLLKFADFILAPVGVLEWGISLFYLSPLYDFLEIVFFVVPIGKITPIITFIISMFIFRAVIALIKTIWDLLPVL